MDFGISQKTLERLEWSEILARLGEQVRTPQARSRLEAPGPDGAPGASLFEAGAEAVRDRLAETAEAHALLAAGEAAPIHAVADLGPALQRARKGGALDAADLLEAASTLDALHDTARFLESRRETCPRLAEAAALISDHPVLRADLTGSLDRATGEVRDEASAPLADARRDAHRLAGEIQQRLAATLQDAGVRACLSDAYYTVRNDRYVLPVRVDSRGGVRGIVHDASRSGTTLFIEPEFLVELNNRHKRAELAIVQETLRVLAELSQALAEVADQIEADLAALERVDLAFARAHLAHAQRAVEPQVGSEGVIDLLQVRHPLIPADEAVPNDLRLGAGFTVLVLSGPNAGGKTVAMKTAALAVLFVRAGLFVPAEAARVDLFDDVLADIGDEQDIREHLSTFSAHMANLARIVERAGPRSLVVLDEVGVGTDPGEGAAIAQAALESLADAGARVVTTTHYNLLKEMAEVDERFANASVEFDPETLAPTYRLHMGLPGASSASAVAARMGLRRDVLERADALLSREDRRLDLMLRELAASRATLEREQRDARHMREETDAVRAEYGAKLEKLQARRDRLYTSMREDLDRAFRDAHGEVARVVRELQREGATSRRAARAREELLDLEARARDVEREAGGDASRAAASRPLEWSRVKPGDPVELRDGGAATLVALPDRRGRVAVRVGSARVVVPMERVGAPPPARDGPSAAARPKPAAVRTPADPEALAGGSSRCDLRGLRVDEALDRLVEALDRAATAGQAQLLVVHGIGTGALRHAVREHLRASPYVARFLPGVAEEGGEGVTLAQLEG